MNFFTTVRALSLASACVLASSAMANAVTIYPSNASAVAGNTTTAAPGFGGSSFQESGASKGEIYVSSVQLFGRQVSFDNVASVTYWTNKPGASSSVDWSFYFYTALQASGNTGSFYHTRLTAEPLYSNSAPVAANTWHQWSTAAGPEALRFYDQARDNNVQGVNNDPTLATLQAGAYVWPVSGTSVDYGSELINLFSLQTGSAWSDGFLGLVDGLTITLRSGEIGTVNLEAAPAAVPEPESLALLSIGIVGMFAAIGRRKRAA